MLRHFTARWEDWKGNSGVYRKDRKRARICTQAENCIKNHKASIKLTETSDS